MGYARSTVKGAKFEWNKTTHVPGRSVFTVRLISGKWPMVKDILRAFREGGEFGFSPTELPNDDQWHSITVYTD